MVVRAKLNVDLILMMYFHLSCTYMWEKLWRIVWKSRFFKESFVHHQKFKIKLNYCNSRHQETNLEISTGNVPKSHAKYFIHIHSKLTWSSAIFLFLLFGNEFSIKVCQVQHCIKGSMVKPFFRLLEVFCQYFHN